MGTGGGYHHKLMYKLNDKWNTQGIQKNDIMKEYNNIQDDIELTATASSTYKRFNIVINDIVIMPTVQANATTTIRK